MSAHKLANKIMLEAIARANREGVGSSFFRVMIAHVCDGSIKLHLPPTDFFKEVRDTYEQVAKMSHKPRLKMNAQLRMVCAEGRSAECKGDLAIAKPFDDIMIWKAAREAGWIESVITAPSRGPDTPIDTVLICEPCANIVLTPELVAADKAMMTEKAPG
jgi:hypothetical protein